MNEEILWQTKLAARIHDPAEKALVLLRDPAGHEGGTTRVLTRLLDLQKITDGVVESDRDSISDIVFKQGLPSSIYRLVQRADWWAAAADRPQWPIEEVTISTASGQQRSCKVTDWAQVRWHEETLLIHPLTGEQYKLPGGLSETDVKDIKRRSIAHFSKLLDRLGAIDNSHYDWRKILLAFWRFGPEIIEEADFGKLGELWRLLPADTRVPDHSIWDHLDLASAFAGAFVADPEGGAALLALSIGPVQGFIAAARKMEDLWAGSHLLSRIAWEAMKPLCELLGPDAILFPRLRGIPQVDLWLRDEMNLSADLFENCEWMKSTTDANPLFSAALPNRFVAVIPASRSREVVDKCVGNMRRWLLDLGLGVVDRLLETAGRKSYDARRDESIPAYKQMRKQLEGFPEVHSASVPFSLVRPRDVARQTDLDVSALVSAMAPFFGAEPGEHHGFLDSPAWKVLSQEIAWEDGTTFFAPNPGVLYPAVYDLVERVLAAAKNARTFAQHAQQGWRCSLSGEAEWLTTDVDQLQESYRQRTDTLWAQIAAKRPAWAKKGEHLSALPAIKRLWPTLFAEEVAGALGLQRTAVDRFVVSTHTMALAKQLDVWLDRGGLTVDGFAEKCERTQAGTVALPRRLVRRHRDNPALKDAKRIPALLDAARESDDERAYERIKKLVCETLAKGLSNKADVRLETYYAVLLMDGDRMGAILSGDEKTAITYRESFHPQIRQGFDAHAARQKLIDHYGWQRRPVSPNRHLVISGALNDFSQIVVRHIVEEEYLGRVIYAGGDDVLAMLPAADLLSAMQRLRYAYSGSSPEDADVHWGYLKKRGSLVCKNGFAYLNGRLMRMMGRNATASCGAVIAHHQAPLGTVARELRQAEKRAKTEGGRDAFSITVVKRSGGALRLTDSWGEPLTLMNDLRTFLSEKGVSRRAVYNTLEWMTDIPDPKNNWLLLESLLSYQLARQAQGESLKEQARQLAPRIAKRAVEQRGDSRNWLVHFLSIAEFLAREVRTVEGGAIWSA